MTVLVLCLATAALYPNGSNVVILLHILTNASYTVNTYYKDVNGR